MTTALHALDYSSASSPDITIGEGVLTEGRVSTIYLPDDAGIWQAFTSGVAGRVYANSQWWVYGGPAQTNLLLYSRDLTDASWGVNGGVPVEAYDQIGLTGEANTASLLTDNEDDQASAIRANATIAADTLNYLCRTFVKKDSDETRFPELFFRLFGGTEAHLAIHLNTATGATAVRATTGTVTSEVNDAGDWWEVLIQCTNNLNTIGRMHLYGAAGVVLGTIDVAAEGSTIYGNCEVYADKTIAQVRGSTPVFTAGSTVTVNQCALRLDDENHADDEGAYYFEFKNVGLNAVQFGGLIGVGTNGRVIYSAAATVVRSTDGSGSVAGPTIALDADDVEYKMAIAYGGINYRINVDDVWGTIATSFNDYTNSNSHIKIVTGQNTQTTAIAAVMLMRNLRREAVNYGEAVDLIDDMMNGIFPGGTRHNYIAITRRTASQMRPKQRMAKPKMRLRDL